MPVVGVLAEADIGDHHEIGIGVLQLAHRLLDDPVGSPGLGALRILAGRQPEEQDRGNVER